MPTVSVIIPSYNHARFLRQRIESVLGQTYQDFEVILLDDCSTDESRSIMSEYAGDPRIRIEFNEKNSGSSFKQWNKGVRLASGKYVWIAESDDYADARLLERLVGRLDAEPTAVLAYCRSWRVSGKGETAGFADYYHSDLHPSRWAADFCADGLEECGKYIVHRNTISNASSVVFRKAIYERVGGADEGLRLCGDWKLWALMALTGGAISYVGEPLNYFRFHDASVSEKSLRNGVWAAEALQVTGLILHRVTPERATLTKVRDGLSHLWIPVVLNRRIPVRLRRAILKNAMTIDPHALRRLLRPALVALRMTLSRRYHSLRVRSSKSSAEEMHSQEKSKSL